MDPTDIFGAILQIEENIEALQHPLTGQCFAQADIDRQTPVEGIARTECPLILCTGCAERFLQALERIMVDSGKPERVLEDSSADSRPEGARQTFIDLQEEPNR